MHKIASEGRQYGLVVEYGLGGDIVRSWHDPVAKTISGMTCITQHNGKLYLGLLLDDHIAVLDY
jgi:hypothetical protein